MKKRVLAIAMSLAMTLSLLPVSALATETGETPEEETSTVNSIQETNSSEKAENQDQELTADVEIDENTQVTVGDSVENPVATIGETGYKTLAEAIEKAPAEATIQMQQDTTLEDAVNIKKDITLDLNGKTITSNSSARWAFAVETSGVTFTIDDTATGGTIKSARDDNSNVIIVSAGELVVKDGTLENNWYVVYVSQSGTATIEGGTLKSKVACALSTNGSSIGDEDYSGNAVMNVKGGHLISKEDVAIYVPAGTLNVSDGTIEGRTAIYVKSGTTSITDGTIKGTGEKKGYQYVGDGCVPTGDAVVIDACGYPNGDPAIEISGGNFESTNASAVADYKQGDNEAKKILVTGGTFDSDVSKYIPSGMTWDDETGKVTVDTSKAVASVNGVGYDDLQEAINAAESKDTVTLLSNTTENVTVAEDDNIILDLNGFTLSGGTDKDSDGNDTVHKDKAAITNNGIITIRDSKGGGVIKRDDVNASADSYYVLLNQGTMIIESGTIYNNSGVNGEGSSLICNLGTNSKEATLTISGGKIQQDNFIAVKNDDYGILNVTGGTIISNEQAIQNWNEAEVTGGTMRGDVITWSYIQVPNNAKMSISGGKIEGNVCSINYYSNNSYGTAPEVTISDNACVMGTLGTYTYNSGVQIPVADDQAKITVNGGDFGNPVSELYLDESLTAELYSTRRNPDAPYSYYKDTSEALENAQPGDNITVVNSETVDTHEVTFNYNYNNGTSNVVAIVADNERITLPTPDNRTGYTFNGWRSSADNDLHKADTSVTITKDTTFTADWTRNQTDRPSGGGSSSSDSGDYLITVDRVSGGRVTVQPGRADKGETVTITVYPNDGYELDELVVTDSRGNEIDLDARSATRFTFTMPGGKVTVEASFVREGGQTQTPQTTFADVPASAWYYDAVEYVYENGLMSGVSGGRFAPDDTLTRAMLVQTLYAMEGRPASASAGFADVASGDWYASAVNWAAANGVVSGVSETGFGPNNALTREQLALILYRFAQYKGYDVTGTSDLAAYADGSSVSGWAAEAMGWAVDAGLISGVGGNQIAPTGTASRAQVAQILMNFCENVAR